MLGQGRMWQSGEVAHMPHVSCTQVDNTGLDLHRVGLGVCSWPEPGWPQGFGSGLVCRLGT